MLLKTIICVLISFTKYLYSLPKVYLQININEIGIHISYLYIFQIFYLSLLSSFLVQCHVMSCCVLIQRLIRPQEDSKRSSDNLYFALLSSISGPILGLYLCFYCLQGHTNLPESGPPIILESEPVMCSDRESNPGRLRGSPEG